MPTTESVRNEFIDVIHAFNSHRVGDWRQIDAEESLDSDSVRGVFYH